MKDKQPSTVKWVCGTILIIFFVSWATSLILPLGIIGAFSSFTKSITDDKKIIEKTVKYISPRAKVKQKNTNNSSKKVQKYIYIVNLNSGRPIRADELKDDGTTISIKNKNGLVMDIPIEDVKNVLRIKI